MINPTARNLPIEDLMHALTDMLLRGNKYVDLMVDEDSTLRMRGAKTMRDKKTEKKNNGKLPPMSNDIDITDIIN